MMSNSGIDQLYFFDQPFKRRYRRAKVASDILPFQVRETRFGGSKGSGTRLKNREHGLESLTELPVGESEEGTTRDSTEIRDDVDTQKEKEEKDTRKASADEDHKHKNEKHRPGHPDVRTIGGISRDDIDDEEDTQKFLFEETKFSAPSILSQLGKLIERIIEDNITEEREAKELYKELESTYGEKLGDKYDSQTFFIILPTDLQRKFNRTYELLIRDTIYTKRLWQNSSYREWTGADKLPSAGDSAVVSNITNITYTGTDEKRAHSSYRDEMHSLHEKHKRLEASDSLGSHATLQGKESKDSGSIL